MYYKNDRDMKLVKDIDKISSKKPEVTDKQAEEAFKTILKWIGEDPNREGLLETPKRVVKAFKEYFKGYHQDASEELLKTFGDVEGYDDMVVEKNITLESHCEHHMAPIIGVAHIANTRTCDYLVAMDSDNEDRPEFVCSLLEKCHTFSKPTVVFAKRSKRSEGFVFRILYFFYRILFQVLAGKTIMFGNFCAIPGGFIRRISYLSDLWAHFPASIMRSGIPFESTPSRRGKRLFGAGKMNIAKFTPLIYQGITLGDGGCDRD